MPQTYPTLKAPRRLLFGPGPGLVAPRVYEAMSQPVVGHLDPFFFEVTEQVRSLIGYAYSTGNVFNIATSGTGTSGMETALANFIEPGHKFALLTNGFFGDRLGEIARRQGAEVVRLAKGWGEPFDPQEVREFIRRERPQVVGFVQAETSTGMFNQAKPICEAAHEVDALTIGDCVTSLGGMPVLVDENGIDKRYRYRLQLHPKGPRVPARSFTHDHFPARSRPPEPTHRARAVVLPRPAPVGQFLHRP
jgi:alanine-glyoxylate transaminase/serine-glyoxylate transaminase/serine-pyruvate transaminase